MPNQLGVEYNAHLIETVLRHAATASAGADVHGEAPITADRGAGHLSWVWGISWRI